MLNRLFDIEGKIALVTGGAQGMGRMIAEGFAHGGAKVYLTSRRADVAESAACEISAFGECVAIPADVSTPGGVVELAREIERRESRLDVVINNAGKTWGAPLESFPDKAWASVIAVNVQAPFTLVRELLPLLTAAASASDPARVINLGSVAGRKVEPIEAYSYAASKAAVQHLSRVLAAELAPRHVTVNTVVPGYFPTSMTAHLREEEARASELLARIPLARLGSAEDIAGICVFLASRASAYVTGAELVVDGGLCGCA